MKSFCVAVLSLLLAGCAVTMKEVLDSWVGRHTDEAMLTWGAPSSIDTLTNGTKMLTWSHQTAVRGTSYSCRVWLTADPGGTIRTWNWEGNYDACDQLISPRKKAKPLGT